MRRIVLEGGKDIALSEPIRLGGLAPGKEIQKGVPLKSGHGAATGPLRAMTEIIEANGFDRDTVTVALPTQDRRNEDGAAGTRGSGGAVGAAAMAVWGGECRFAFRRR